MDNAIDTLRAARDAARAEYERLDAEVRKRRAALTAAERQARAARVRYEAALLAHADAVEGKS